MMVTIMHVGQSTGSVGDFLFGTARAPRRSGIRAAATYRANGAPRAKLPVIARLVLPRTRIMPHQGKRECARRRKA